MNIEAIRFTTNIPFSFYFPNISIHFLAKTRITKWHHTVLQPIIRFHDIENVTGNIFLLHNKINS